MPTLIAVASADWNIASTWNPAQIPASGDTVDPDTFTVTIPASTTATCLDLQIPASGTVVMAPGSYLEIDDALSATINIAVGGALQASGTTASPCTIASAVSAPTNPIKFTCDGSMDIENTTFAGMTFVAANGTMTLIDSDVVAEMTGTSPVVVTLSGTLIMTRSSWRIRDTTQTWTWNVSGGTVTMDKGSDFGGSFKMRLNGATTALVFTDNAISIDDRQRPRLVAHEDLLGATKARARKMGFGGRYVTIDSSIQEANIDDWSVLNDLKDSLTEVTLRFIWDEGSLNNCVIYDLVPKPRTAADAGERFFTLVLLEIQT